MSARLFIVVGLLLGMLWANVVFAVCPCTDICYTTSGSGSMDPSDFDCTYDSVNDVYDISIVASGSSGGFTIHITGANGAVIRNLDVKNSGGSGTVVEVNVVGDDDDLARVINVKKDSMSSGEVWVGTIDTTDGIGASSYPYGEIVVDKIGSLSTGGDITTAISVAGAAGEAFALDNLACGGDMGNSLSVANGEVGTIQVDGNLAALPSASLLWTLNGGSVDEIIIAGDAEGTLDLAGSVLRRLEVGEMGNAGVFQINIGSMSGTNAGISVFGDVVRGSMSFLSALDVPIEIDGSFGTGTNISIIEVLEYGDLLSQITINKANIGGSWGLMAEVCFDGNGGFGQCEDSIATPYYIETAEDLGGGSIGLAPFRLHETSCAPANDATIQIDSSLLLNGVCLFQCDLEELDAEDEDWFDFAIVRHYGPVEWASGDPLTVKRRSLACGGSETWTNVTSSFDFAINTGSGDREIKVMYVGAGYPFWPIDYEYRIEPVAGVLKCKNVDGSPDVADYDYEFSFVAQCDAFFMAHYDQDNDEALTELDIVAWSVDPVDLDDDSVADEVDLGILWDVVLTYGN